MRTGFITIFCLCSLLEVVAQPLDFLRSDTLDTYRDLPFVLSISSRTQLGRHLTTGVPILETSIEKYPFTSLEFRLGFSSYGKKKWQQVHNYPDFGIGYYQCRFVPLENPVGQPRAIYAYYNQILLSSGRFSLNYDLSTGLAFHFEEYDPVENRSQFAIGSEYNMHFSFGVEGRINLTESVILGVGANNTHFSNGRIRTPQRGMNLVSLNSSINILFIDPVSRKRSGYSKKSVLPQNIVHDLTGFIPRWEYYIIANAAVATPEHKYSDRELVYSIFTTSLIAGRHYSYKGKIIAGIDFFYDESLSERYDIPVDEISWENKTYYGLVAGHELMINRVTLVTQMGIPLDNRNVSGKWYGRFGVRIDLIRNLFIRGTLKVPDSWKADFIEWGIGFNFYNK